VLYSLLALLGSLTGLILVRYPLWAAAWILTGADFWLLPNLTSDKVGNAGGGAAGHTKGRRRGGGGKPWG
jgi:hypothetical protein